MSTYTLYYQNPVVHTQPLQSPTTQHLNPGLKLQSPKQDISITEEGEPSHSPPTSQRFTLSSGPMKGFWSYDQQQSPLFRLPAELRNEVYEYLLCPDACIINSSTEDLSVRGFNQTCISLQLHPAILSTCRKAHEEAEGLLYARHTFHAHPSLLNTLPHLTSASRPVLYPSVISKIKRWQITLRLDTDPRFTYSDVTHAFSGAEFLEIRVWQSQFEAADWGVLKLFTGVRGVGMARVGGSVGEELSRWLEGVMMMPVEREKKLCECNDKKDLVCRRCHRKVEVGRWIGGEWNVWKFGGR